MRSCLLFSLALLFNYAGIVGGAAIDVNLTSSLEAGRNMAEPVSGSSFDTITALTYLNTYIHSGGQSSPPALVENLGAVQTQTIITSITSTSSIFSPITTPEPTSSALTGINKVRTGSTIIRTLPGGQIVTITQCNNPLCVGLGYALTGELKSTAVGNVQGFVISAPGVAAAVQTPDALITAAPLAPPPPALPTTTSQVPHAGYVESLDPAEGKQGIWSSFDLNKAGPLRDSYRDIAKSLLTGTNLATHGQLAPQETLATVTGAAYKDQPSLLPIMGQELEETSVIGGEVHEGETDRIMASLTSNGLGLQYPNTLPDVKVTIPYITVGPKTFVVEPVPMATGQVLIEGKILSLGGNVVVEGQTISLLPGGNGVVVQGSTEIWKVTVVTIPKSVLVKQTESVVGSETGSRTVGSGAPRVTGMQTLATGGWNGTQVVFTGGGKRLSRVLDGIGVLSMVLGIEFFCILIPRFMYLF